MQLTYAVKTFDTLNYSRVIKYAKIMQPYNVQIENCLY